MRVYTDAEIQAIKDLQFEEIKALAEFLRDSYELGFASEALQLEIISGREPQEVIDEFKADPVFCVWWRLTGGDMEKWLQDNAKNAVKLRKERAAKTLSKKA